MSQISSGRDRGRGPGGRRRRLPEPPAVSNEDLRAWFAGNIPDDWFTGPVEVSADRDEILITGDIAVPKVSDGDDESVASSARIDAFREDTRSQRMAIADRAQEKYLRKVSWAASCGTASASFTIASVPVMTRLLMDERVVLDTLIDAGVARSRSEALAWCVQLVAENEAEWIGKIRDAMKAVEDVRAEGPSSRGFGADRSSRR